MQVALAKSKGNLSMAIELLRKHVDVFMLDKMAWEELGELYLQVYATYTSKCCCCHLPHSLAVVFCDVRFLYTNAGKFM